MRISGFTIVRDAIRLDFPIVESVRSILPLCDEVVVNVGRSEDGTLELVRSIADPKIRIIETEWDFSRGGSVLRVETARAMTACRHPWGIYIQADEVLHEDGASRFLETIRASAGDPRIEAVALRYRHIFAEPGLEAVNRHWYRREVRAVRLDPAARIEPFRDAQGFRVGPRARRIRARLADAEMFHYGYLRSAAAMRGRVGVDRELYPDRRAPGDDPAQLAWFPGIRPFRGRHPAVAAAWVARHAADPDRRVGPPNVGFRHLRFYLSDLVERATGHRPFEFRNYELV